MNSLRSFITRSGQGCLLVIALLVLDVTRAHAQSFAVGIHVASSQWSEFDGTDRGIGGRMSWLPIPMLGVEADITIYPADFPPGTAAAFSNAYRFEGLFGATFGPRLNRVRPFVKAAAGFLRVETNATAFACVAIFPPPLACILAAGATLPAYEIGGGVEMNTTDRTFIRVDLADRILSYPGPTFRGPGLRERVDEGFFGGAMRLTIGGGVRF
jgi:hypothetical protein